MPNKAILRLAKLKGGSVSSSAMHVFRERAAENVNDELTKNNFYIGAKNSSELRVAINKRIATAQNKFIRSDAVKVVEFMITASPEFFSTHKSKDYFKKAHQFFKEKFGEENLISFAVHLDELTPHAHVYVVPIINNKLNAKQIFGTRQKLRDLQTDFAESVKSLGLERGVKGSTARHQDVKTFYANLATESELNAAKAALDAKREELIKAEIEIKNKNEKLKATSESITEMQLGLSAMQDDLKSQTASLRTIDLASILRKTGSQQSHYDKNTWLTPMGSITINNETYRNEAGKLRKGAIDLVEDLFSCKYKEALLWLKTKFSEKDIINTAKKRTEENVIEILQNDLQQELIFKQKIIPEIVVQKTQKIIHSPLVKSKNNIFGDNDFGM